MLGLRRVHATVPLGVGSLSISSLALGLLLLSPPVAAQVPDTTLWVTGTGSLSGGSYYKQQIADLVRKFL